MDLVAGSEVGFTDVPFPRKAWGLDWNWSVFRVKSETPRLQGTEPPHPDLLLSPVHYSLVYLPSLEE